MADEQQQDTGKGDVHARLARIYARLDVLAREGHMRSSGASFDYATIDQLREAARAEMGQEGVVMYPRKVRAVREAERSSSNNRAQFDTVLKVTWRFAVDHADFIDVPTFGRSLNNSDKDYNTALTYSERNALLAVFHFSTGEDPEQERPEAETQPQRRQGPPRGVGKDQPYTPAPTAEAYPPLREQLERATALRGAIQALQTEEEKATFSGQIRMFAEREIGRTVSELNRDEFGQLVSWLEEYAAKLGINPQTGEMPSPAPEPAPAPEGPPVPAQPAQQPDPAPVPAEQQQAIEAAAAEVQKELSPDPDNQPSTGYENAVEMARQANIDQGRLIELMMDAGAAKESDLDKAEVWSKFLGVFEKATAPA
jgi:hypothetical protein